MNEVKTKLQTEDEQSLPSSSGKPVMQMTTDIVSSFVSNNPVSMDSLPQIITDVHKTLSGLSLDKRDSNTEKPKPAVPISKSVTDDYLICLEDGKKLKMLRRYLRSAYGMTPDEYRDRWNLPIDYPMVAPNYTKTRSRLAKENGLGKVGRTKS